MVLADGAAQKLVWSSKGGAGTKLCMLCANVHAAKKACNDADPEEVHCDAKRYNSNWRQKPAAIGKLPEAPCKAWHSQQKGICSLAISHWPALFQICYHAEPELIS